MKKNSISFMIVFFMLLAALFSSEQVEGAIVDPASPFTFPPKYIGNPVRDAGDTIIDVSQTKFGALPGNSAIDSMAMLYKGNYYVLGVGGIQRISPNATNGTKYIQLYSTIDHDFVPSNLQIMNDIMLWEERNSSDAGNVRIRRMKIDGTGLTTFSRYGDKIALYNGKMYVRSRDVDSWGEVGIVSYNLDGSGRKVIYSPAEGKRLALVPPSVGSIQLLEYGGGYTPFGFSGDHLYYVEQPSNRTNGTPELWRMQLDGNGKELVRKVETESSAIGFRMIHQNYLYYTSGGATYRIPFSGGKAEQVLADDDIITLFGNKMFFPRNVPMQYVLNESAYYAGNRPIGAIYVADADGKNVRYLFSTDNNSTIVNIVSLDYLFAETSRTRGVFFSANPNNKIDLSISTGTYDAQTNTVYNPMIITAQDMNFPEKGRIANGWYYLRSMYNYLSINPEGQAEFNDAEPYQKFRFTYQGAGTYRIETETGKVVNLGSASDIKNGYRLMAQNYTAFDWYVGAEKNDLFSVRPYIARDYAMNASGKKKVNGTAITLWNYRDAPEHARWRFIPAPAPAVSDTIKMIINETPYETDPAPYLKNGRTLVPMRHVFEILGAELTWNQAEFSVTAKKGKDEMKLFINSTTAYVNGKQVTLDAAAELKDGRTMVPLRFVSEALGAKVYWIDATRTVVIETK